MRAEATAFTLFSIDITWMHVIIALAALFVHAVLFGLVLEKRPRIDLGKALGAAEKSWNRHFTAFLKMMLVEFCVMMIGLAPLIFLFSENLRFLAFLSYPIWMLWVVPVRMNAAAAMQDALSGESPFSCRLISLSRWRDQVVCGYKRMALLPLWAIPLGGGLYYAYRVWQGTDEMDAFSTLQAVQDFGNGDVKAGLYYLLGILGVLILILLIGFAFHSGVRHALALGNPKLVNGHHGMIAFGWFLSSIVFMLPFWIALAIVLFKWILPLLNDPNGLFSNAVHIPRVRQLLMVLGAGVLLTLPFLPLRSLAVASMVRRIKEREVGDAAK